MGEQYKHNKKLLDEGFADEDEINTITEFIKEQQIQCYKYNYVLDTSVQNYLNFESTIGLSEDEKELIITNIKPNQKK